MYVCLRMQLVLAAAAVLSVLFQAGHAQPFPRPGKYYAIVSSTDDVDELSLGDVGVDGMVACHTTWGNGENLWRFVKEGENYRLFNNKFEKDKLTAFKQERLGTFAGDKLKDQLWKVTPLGGLKVSIKNADGSTTLQISNKTGECELSKENETNNMYNVWYLDDQTYNPPIVEVAITFLTTPEYL